MRCTFFGHRVIFESITNELRSAIIAEINSGTTHFYVGNNGQFDYTVQCILEELLKEGYQAKYSIVISHLNEKALNEHQERTVFPETLEGALPKFRIIKRNEWMIKSSDKVICYVRDTLSNAYKWSLRAKKKGLKIINLSSELEF